GRPRLDPARCVSAERGWAVVTGASSGLGREFALELASRGYPVLAAARRLDRLGELAGDVESRGGSLEPLAVDLSTPAGVDALLAAAAGRTVDLLVNNAGVATYGLFASLAPGRERELVRLNVEAVVALTRGLLPGMLERRRGGVINVASQMAFQAMPYFAAYAASKSFVLSFTEALAEELRGSVGRRERARGAALPPPAGAARGRGRAPGPRPRPDGDGDRRRLQVPDLLRAPCAALRRQADDARGAEAAELSRIEVGVAPVSRATARLRWLWSAKPSSAARCARFVSPASIRA